VEANGPASLQNYAVIARRKKLPFALAAHHTTHKETKVRVCFFFKRALNLKFKKRRVKGTQY
jgi:hypothetical protein